MKTATVHIYHSGLRSECQIGIGRHRVGVPCDRAADAIADHTRLGYNITLVDHHGWEQIPTTTLHYTSAMTTTILVDYGVRTEIAKTLGVSQPTIRKALSGRYNEHNEAERNLALRIRKCAINLGGVEVKAADSKYTSK